MNNENITFLLPTDVAKGAFAPSLAAWHRMVLYRDNYICQKCGEEITKQWKQSGQRKLATNKGHHIISQNLADQCERRELKTLLANGIAYCSDCHWEEHRRLGGYEYGGANKAFGKLKGLEDLSGVSNPAEMELWLLDKDRRKLYELFLMIIQDYEPELKEFINETEYEYKAWIALSTVFYFNVYEELELLDWNRMSEWTKEQLQNAVEVANEYWNEEVEDLAQEYDKRRK